MEWAIRTEDLGVEFRGGLGRTAIEALRSVAIRVAPGSVVGVLGPNGSGKTTLLKVLAGIERPTSGQARVLDLRADDPALIPRVGFQPEEAPPWPALTGREHLRQLALLAGLDRATARSRADAWLERMGLGGAATRRVGGYSTGMAKRLALAAALIHEPEVLLLDEPTSGLDPEGSQLVIGLLQQLAERGTAVLLASHHLQEVEAVCESVVALVDGRIRAEGPLETLLATGEEAIAVRGLDDANWPTARAALESAGFEVSGRQRLQRHLFSLFRTWTGGAP